MISYLIFTFDKTFFQEMINECTHNVEQKEHASFCCKITMDVVLNGQKNIKPNPMNIFFVFAKLSITNKLSETLN